MSKIKKGKATAFAVVTPDGFICCALIRHTKKECIQAHEQMFFEHWYVSREYGYKIKKIKVSTKYR